MKIQKGSKVKLDYTGKLEDGSVFDTSKHEEHSHPLEFVAGEGQVVAGFDSAVMGMEKGEKKTFTLEPKDAYGMPNPEMYKPFPKDKLPKEQEVKPGMALVFQSPEGQQIPVLVKDVNETEVILDMNHPLAGKTLTFEIEILSVGEVGLKDEEKKEDEEKE